MSAERSRETGEEREEGGGEGREKTVTFNKFEIAAIVTYSRH